MLLRLQSSSRPLTRIMRIKEEWKMKNIKIEEAAVEEKTMVNDRARKEQCGCGNVLGFKKD